MGNVAQIDKVALELERHKDNNKFHRREDGTSSHQDLTDLTTDDHHTENHADSKHTEPPILKAFFNAKGDLITASADNTPSLLSVGSDDQILMADSAAGGGLKWVSPGTPVSIGDVNSPGTADTFSRSDHIHARVKSLATSVVYTKTTANGVDQAEATLYSYPQIPANTLAVGDIFVLRMNGIISVNSNQPLMNFRWRFGTSATIPSNTLITLLNTFTSNSTTNAGWWMEATLNVVSIGATGTLTGHIHYYNEMNSQFSAGQEISNQIAAVTVNTTIANYLGFTADWSTHGSGHVLTAQAIF